MERTQLAISWPSKITMDWMVSLGTYKAWALSAWKEAAALSLISCLSQHIALFCLLTTCELFLNLNCMQHFIAMVMTQALTPQVFSVQLSASHSYNFQVC